MFLNKHYVLVLLLLLSPSVVLGEITDLEFMDKSPYITDLTKLHKEAILLISEGKHNKGWEMLLPAAKKGDANSMYILGKMIISTPKLYDRLDTARKLLTQSAKQGHALAIHALKELDTINTIDRLSKMKVPPLEFDNEAKRKYEAALRKQADRESGKTWSVEFVLFLDGFDPKYNALLKQMDQVKLRLKDKVNLRYVFVAEYEAMKNQRFASPRPGFKAPQQGFEVDVDRQMSKSMRVNSYPSIVGISSKGNRVFELDDNSQIINPLMNYFRVNSR